MSHPFEGASVAIASASYQIRSLKQKVFPGCLCAATFGMPRYSRITLEQDF